MNKGLKRILELLDENTFQETAIEDSGQGIITGTGKIHGKKVCVYAHDPEISAGAMSEAMTTKISNLLDHAISTNVPFIALNESAGAKIQDGVSALAGLGEIFKRQISACGTIPQISVCFGSCAGGAVYSSALSDFTIMVRDSSYMYLTGPSVVKTATGEVTDHELLGGSSVHGSRSGVAQFVAENEEEALNTVRNLLEYLDSSAKRVGDPKFPCEGIMDIVPDEPSRSYNMLDLIECIADSGSILEVHKDWAKNIITTFARIAGHAVGIVANQPRYLAGALDSKASRKAARFIDICNSFRLPIITFVDVPGFLCGSEHEQEGIIEHGAALLKAYGKASVQKISITLRKSYGGAHIAMCCKQLAGSIAFAWPHAELAVMGKTGAGKILHDTDSEPKDSSVSHALKEGYIDEIISPEDTRNRIIQILDSINNHIKEHETE